MRKTLTAVPVLLALLSGCQEQTSDTAVPGGESAHAGDLSVLNLVAEYYDNDYLLEESVERLNVSRGGCLAGA